jgi:uncharacterized Ntn-hydrolase superfamily protein
MARLRSHSRRQSGLAGKKCGEWAGHKTGKNFACQGNILAGEAVVNDTAKTFEEAKGPLALRLMAALEAGQKAGGDKRMIRFNPRR